MESRRRQDAVVGRLRALARSGRIDAIEVHAWPREVSLAGGAHSDVLERFEDFERWADERAASIRPPFSIRVQRSAYTGETDTTLVTPVVCLAVYEGSDLVGVYPCSRDGSVTTVDDCIDRLENRTEATSRRPGRSPAVRRRPTAGDE